MGGFRQAGLFKPQSFDRADLEPHNWRAQWIWAPRADHAATYQHFSFRRAISLRQPPTAARCLIAADTYCRLWINGQFVIHGNARTTRGCAVFDDIEVSSLLRSGPNVVAAQVIYVGVDVFDAVPQAPGFLMEIVLASGEVLVATDESWKTSPDSPYITAAPRFSKQRGFVEIFDRRYLDERWTLAEFRDDDWPSARLIGPVGSGPWTKLMPRITPLPASGLVGPQTVRDLVAYDGQGHKPAPPDGSSESQDPQVGYGDLPSSDGQLPVILHTERAVVFDGDVRGDLGRFCNSPRRSVTITPRSCDPAITFDFGENQVGFIRFDVEAEPEAVIDVVWSERPFHDGHIRPCRIASNNFLRYIATGGRQRFEAFHPQTMRFVKLIVRHGCGPVTIHDLGLRQYHYLDRCHSGFSCSDSGVQKIYDAAKRTCVLNTTDAYMDCPSRERGAWLHDSHWGALGGFFLLGDLAVNRHMLELAASASWPYEVPGMVDCCVGGSHGRRGSFYTGHALFFVIQLDTYRQLSGDQELGQQLALCVQHLMEGFSRWQNEIGLLEDVPGSPFLDYSEPLFYEGPHVGVGMNALYARALDAAAAVTGRGEFTDQAGRIRAALDERAWDDRSGVFVDRLVRCGGHLTPEPDACETTQYLALWAQVPGPDRQRQLWHLLRDAYDQPYARRDTIADGRLRRANLYTFFQRAETGFRFGEHGQILDDIRNAFGPMAAGPTATLWEVFDPDYHKNEVYTYCHGLAAAVGAFLVRDYLGIRPGSRGLRNAVIEPHPAGLRWAKGFLTSDAGRVGVSWRFDKGRFELEAQPVPGGTATLRLPSEALACDLTGRASSTFEIDAPMQMVLGS